MSLYTWTHQLTMEDDLNMKGPFWIVFQAKSKHEYYKSVARVLQECYKSVTRVLQGCYKGVTRVFQGCYKGAIRVL